MAPGLPGSPSDHASARTPIPFQFQDVQVLAKTILARANQQAQRKLEAAGKQAEDIEKAAWDDGVEKGRQEGYPKGLAEGRAAGEAAAREEFAAQTDGVAAALEAMVEELQARKLGLEAEAEADLLRLAVGIARLVVRREIAIDEDYILPTLRAAIRTSTERSDLVARVHPDDLAAVKRELPSLRNAFTDLGRVRLEPDPAVGRGGIRLVGQSGEVDMRLTTQFAAIEDALLGRAEDASFPLPGVLPEEPPGADESGEESAGMAADMGAEVAAPSASESDVDAQPDVPADDAADVPPETEAPGDDGDEAPPAPA